MSPAWVSMIGSAVSEPPPVLSIHFCGTLQQSGVQVKDISRIRLAARRAPQQQRNLAVGGRMFGQVVVDHQRMLAAVTEIFPHGAPAIGGNVLHGRGI